MADEFIPLAKMKTKPDVSNLRLEFTPEKAAEIRSAAAKYNVSMRAFCQQAIDFALEHLG